MNLFYMDASALVKRYLSETGSDWINHITSLATGNTIIIAEITQVEVAAALASRCRASDGISTQQRNSAIALLNKHRIEEYIIVAINRDIINCAIDQTQKHRLRGYDAVQLATALIVQEHYDQSGFPSLTFVTADNDLVTAAREEGLATQNPNVMQEF
jgi:predicted nucleic acid-binding protein